MPPSHKATRNPDAGWFQRRERLRVRLSSRGPSSAADLAEALGWDVREVSAKLQDLRRAGMAEHEDKPRGHVGRLWWAT